MITILQGFKEMKRFREEYFSNIKLEIIGERVLLLEMLMGQHLMLG